MEMVDYVSQARTHVPSFCLFSCFIVITEKAKEDAKAKAEKAKVSHA